MDHGWVENYPMVDAGSVLIFELKSIRRGPLKLWQLHETKRFAPHESKIVSLSFVAGRHDCVAIAEEGELTVIDCDSPSVDIRLSLDGGKQPGCLAL